MMQRKKSRFLVFLLSFIPGAGEMYMGFMKMGLSLMLGFMILAAVVGFTNLGALAVFPIVLYAYSFFHANNLATLDDRMFHSIRDEYLFGFGEFDNWKFKLEGRNRKIAAVILIVLGVMMLWQVVFNLLCDIFGWDNRFLSAVHYFVRDDLPRAVVGIGVIWAGFALIRGKRIAIEDKDDAAEEWTRHRGRQAADEWTGYRERQAADEQPMYREQQTAGDWTGHDGNRPGADGFREQNGQMTVRETQPVVDGRIIYGEGPVADGSELPENRN
ncbi:MAG: GAP family protein [Lachnospiraceae bacterium]|nr:GAP family protein [Lachnospiraceae bacterium]